LNLLARAAPAAAAPAPAAVAAMNPKTRRANDISVLWASNTVCAAERSAQMCADLLWMLHTRQVGYSW
jgi:hypothetical protein